MPTGRQEFVLEPVSSRHPDRPFLTRRFPLEAVGANTDYVTVMDFEGDRFRHIDEDWNSGWAIKELSW
jgi:hypothetical protein